MSQLNTKSSKWSHNYTTHKAKLHIKDAYYRILIYEPHQKILKLEYRSRLFKSMSFQMVIQRDQESSQNY